jgi:signal transduction histidine kinase
VRSTTDIRHQPNSLRRAIERLEGLPLRAATVRAWLREQEAEGGNGTARLLELDPGWELSQRRDRDGALDRIASSSWWLRPNEALDRLWMQSIAVRCAAKRLSAESGAAEPSRHAGLGMLLSLGLWAVAAVDLGVLAELLSIRDLSERRDAERKLLGVDASTLGRQLAERWVGDRQFADLCWLHQDRSEVLASAATNRSDLALFQRAFSWAERTPWALTPQPEGETGRDDPRIRLLMAEVQMRCVGGLVGTDVSEHEERLSRSHATLLLRHGDLQRTVQAQTRFLDRFVSASPTESVEQWADESALSWCREPGVASARVVWHGDAGGDLETLPCNGKPDPTVTIVPLGNPAHPLAEVQLKLDADDPSLDLPNHPARAAWSRWAESIAHRESMTDRLDTLVFANRSQRDDRDREGPSERLEALAEFAAGAGHELNNPLAVIVGRAQLLLAKANDPDTVRSLRAVIGQGRRAHRILRDLMYVARPPALRPRPCVPDDLVRSCLRDLQPEVEAKGLSLIVELDEHCRGVWIDPDPLRHLIDVLTRNALEATPQGGTIRVTSCLVHGQLEWTVRNSGQGIDPRDGKHLFDPFFCGRQAGRGLGLGLPRAARFIDQVGGRLQWQSSPEQGTTFRVTIPLPAEPPRVERARTA